MLCVSASTTVLSRHPSPTSAEHFPVAAESHYGLFHDMPPPPAPVTAAGLQPVATTVSSLQHHLDLKSDLKMETTMPLVPEPHRSTDILPITTTELSLERRLSSSGQDSRLALDQSLGLLSRYQNIHELSRLAADTRYSERHMLPQSPTYPLSSTHTNMAILEQSRALTTLPLSGVSTGSTPYPLVSPLSSIPPQNTLAPTPYLASSPVLSGSFLYPGIYNNPNPSQYVHTNEGRTLELLGAGQQQGADVTRSQTTLSTPPAPQFSAIGRDREQELKQKAAVAAAAAGQLEGHRDPSQAAPDAGDPVWRPY